MSKKPKTEEDWALDTTVAGFIQNKVNVDGDRATRIADLFEQGNEVAYVVRYRIDAHGGLPCEDIRRAYEVFVEARKLNKIAQKALAKIGPKIECVEERQAVTALIKASLDDADIKDLTKSYSSGARRTKASLAKEMGFDEVAKGVMEGRKVDLQRFVGGEKVKTLADAMEQARISLADFLNLLPETVECAGKISKLETRVRMLVHAAIPAKTRKAIEKGDHAAQANVDHFKQYVDFEKPVNYMENYQILALERAEEREALVWKVDIDVDAVKQMHPAFCLQHNVHRSNVDLFREAFEYSFNKLFVPKIQRAARRFLIARAEQAAIECFARNLRQLFARDAVTSRHVVALDPGFAACKAAFLAPDGAVLGTDQFGLCNGESQFDQKGKSLLAKWATVVEKEPSPLLLITIGNGKASYETQCAVAAMIRQKAFGHRIDVSFCVVPENGASKYSITELAEADLPGMPPTLRSAVSIGRRVIDPMGEYVKIEPKNLGMGMYQHSVNETKLADALELVVRERVSLRGVDVNSASVQLLRQVCGLNKTTAARIVELRNKEGRIVSREDLKRVKGLGKVSFTQCAGFLTVRSAHKDDDSGEPAKKKAKKTSTPKSNPLDSTIVHPDQYKCAEKVFEKVGIDLESFDLVANFDELERRLHSFDGWNLEEQLVVDLLCKRPYILPPFPFMKDVRKLASLRVGEIVDGYISNQVDFGLFVDIGVERNGLAHKSSLRAPYPEVGTSAQFRIKSVDIKNGRVGLEPAF